MLPSPHLASVVFSSHLFLFGFLPLALALYFAAPRRLRHFVLTVASYVFYGWANPLFVVLMFASTAVDFACGLVIAREPCEPLGVRSRAQRRALLASICANLSLLGFFKYFGFATRSWDGLVAALGLSGLSLHLAFDVALPLGISFYTFQSMSYTIDVYRGHARAGAELDRLRLLRRRCSRSSSRGRSSATRRSPISCASRTHTIEKFSRGCRLPVASASPRRCCSRTRAGRSPTSRSRPLALTSHRRVVGVVAYAFQIYFDFSGYSDMAIGLGLMLGFAFPKNFDVPYRSQSITEFWRRWHISLSSWLRDYLYIPLGGNRDGRASHLANLMIVMLLGGLWHGASWNFVDLGRDPRRLARTRAGARQGRCMAVAAGTAAGGDDVRGGAGGVGVLPRAGRSAGRWTTSARCSARRRRPGLAHG